MKYYILPSRKDRTTGPYTKEELQEVLKAFPIEEGDVVCSEVELEEALKEVLEGDN